MISANPSLAVFTPQVGATFINRHVRDLVPGNTVAVVRYREIPPGGFWEPSCPLFHLDRWATRLRTRLAHRLGADPERLRESALAHFLRVHRVTVVLGEFLDSFIEFVPLLQRLGIPYVVQGHGVDVSAALRRPGVAEQYLEYRNARAVLTRCEPHRQRLIALGLPGERVHVNHGGVSISPSLPLRGPEAAKRLLAIGFMSPKKSPIFLLESFRRAAIRDVELTLDYVGGGPLFPAVLQFVDACGLASRVRLHGLASEETKHRLLDECGVFVQHSITDAETGDEEGLPAAIQEAMGHGLAVVSTRHAGIPEAVADGSTGILVDERDVDGMADAILQIAPAAREMGQEGYRRAAAHTWESEKSRLLQWIGGTQRTGTT
jgi:glycosyltransferase involved in cell wall biosynthesis